MDGGLTQHERYLFDLQGYVVREGVLGPDELAALHACLDAAALHAPAGTIQSQRFSGLLSMGRPLRDLLDHPAVLGVLADLVGPFLRLDHAYGIQMAPGTSGLLLHGGGRPHDPSQSYVHDGKRMHNGLTAVLWALVDHPPGAGGFGCIPASHKANERLPADVARFEAHLDWVREVAMPAGSALIFTEALTHGTLPWRGPGERRVLAYKYSPGHLSWNAYEPPPAEIVGVLSDRQRRLLEPPAVAYRRPLV